MKIKILVDAHVFDGAPQGTTTYIKGLYSALAQDQRFEITLCAHNINNLKAEFGEAGFLYLQLKETSSIKRLLFEIPNLIKKGQFHYAHFQYIVTLRKTCFFINTIHDILFLDYPNYFPKAYRLSKGWWFWLSAKRSDIVATVSEFSKQALIKHYKLAPSQVVLTPNACALENVEHLDVRSHYGLRPYLLFVSRFEPRKNHLGILTAFFNLKLDEKGYDLVLIGRRKDVAVPEFEAAYAALSDEKKKHVKLFENINQQHLSNFYRQCSLFVYPSFAEGFGIPPLEAVLSDCKVLCSNATAMSDFDFLGNQLVDVTSKNEFEQAIARTLADTNYPLANYKKQALEKYTWQNSSEAFVQAVVNHHKNNSD